MFRNGANSNKLATCLYFFFATLLYVCNSYKVQDGFYFDPAPVNQDIVDGEGTKMRCDVSNRNSISFYWTMNGVRLANVSRRFQEGSDLRFLWVNRALDNGTYHCIATNVSTGIALQSISARLNILWIDKTAEVQLIKPEEASSIVEGNEVLLKCDADGNDEPQIEWFKNKIRITNSDRIKIQKGKHLRIANVNSVDNGVYSCKSKNSAGTSTNNVGFIVNIRGGNPQMITDSFEEFVLVNKGTAAFLNCQYPPEELAELSWFHDKNKLDSSEKFIIHENGTLEMRNVEKNDEGVYKCSANFKAGGSQTFAVELKTSYLEEFSSRDIIPPATHEPHVVARGGRYSARCYPPNGLPKPTVKWYDPNGVEIEVDRKKPLYFTEGVISFANIQPSYAGRYKCVAENSAGQVHQDVELAVSEPSKISRSPLSTRAKEGGSATFDCKVTGSKYPITKIGWMFEEKPLEQNSKFVMDESNGILTIDGIEPTDEGNYVCYTKTIGQPTVVSGNAFLYVEKRLKFDPTPSDSYVELGEADTVECKATGSSHPSITWYREGRQPLQRGVVSSEGQLVFEKVQVTDAGKYSCYASTAEEAINTTINIYTTVKPRLKIKPINTTVVEGNPVVMHCVAIGEPAPKIVWYKNTWSNELDKNRFKIFSNGTLILSTPFVEDSGLYGCAASSPSATVREEAYISVVTKDESDALKRPEGKFSTTMIAIVVCVTVAVLIVILVIVLARRRNRRGKNGDPEKGTPLKDNCGNNYQKSPEQMSLMHGRELCKGGSQADGSETRSHVSGVSSQQSHASNTLSRSFKPFDKYIFSRTFLNNFGRLGAGNFGEVYIAEAYNVVPGVMESLVMVKVLFTKDENHRNEFVENMDMFSKTNHPNFSKLLAVCVDDPYSAIFEYTDCGILKKYLEASRPRKDDTKDRNVVLKNSDKLNICLQVAQAMDYLNNQLKLYHKDLATRNVLITSTFNIKITNLGLTQDLYVNEYYSFQNKSLPIRWMSPESLLKEYKRDTSASDAWSFGVFMWEVYTLACLPMSDKTNEMVIEGLTKESNVELPYPPGCPPEVWSLITMCRNFDSQARPSFSDMTLALSQCIPTDIIA